MGGEKRSGEERSREDRRGEEKGREEGGKGEEREKRNHSGYMAKSNSVLDESCQVTI